MQDRLTAERPARPTTPCSAHPSSRLALAFDEPRDCAIIATPCSPIISVLAFDVIDGRIQTIRGVMNPDKLDHLGPVGNLYALLKTRPRDVSSPN